MTKDLSIESLCGGAVNERINRALRKVSDNILDPNTDAKKKRSITLQLTFKPNEDDREEVGVEANVIMKLAPEEGVSTQFFINRDLANDTVTITECVKGQIKGQLSIDDLGLMVREDEVTAEELGCDPVTGEIVEERPALPDYGERPTIMDFRKQQYAQEG